MRPKPKMSIDGILNVNKPEGKTSFGVVAWFKRLIGERHIGHGGTLDPKATGVLPICFGQGTRVAQFLIDSSKVYLAKVELGTITDTFDSDGKIIQREDPSGITVDQVEQVLGSFLGSIDQVPPIYSALKQHGRRSYELARAGIPVELSPRKVEIINIEIIDCRLPLITVKVECGKGTYIRSLAHDLGQRLGCGAFLKSLVRLRCGPFLIEDALSVSQIEDAFHQGVWREFLHSIDSPILGWRAVIVDERNELSIRNGRSLSLGQGCLPSEKHCRAYSSDGRFIAVLRFLSEKRLWHPEKVFSL